MHPKKPTKTLKINEKTLKPIPPNRKQTKNPNPNKNQPTKRTQTNTTKRKKKPKKSSQNPKNPLKLNQNHDNKKYSILELPNRCLWLESRAEALSTHHPELGTRSPDASRPSICVLILKTLFRAAPEAGAFPFLMQPVTLAGERGNISPRVLFTLPSRWTMNRRVQTSQQQGYISKPATWRWKISRRHSVRTGLTKHWSSPNSSASCSSWPLGGWLSPIHPTCAKGFCWCQWFLWVFYINTYLSVEISDVFCERVALEEGTASFLLQLFPSPRLPWKQMKSHGWWSCQVSSPKQDPAWSLSE